MSIQSTSLLQTVNVSTVSKIVDTDTFINVIKRRETPRYLDSVPEDAVNIAYVGGELVEVARNLSIIDRSASLFPNREFEAEYRTLTYTDMFSTPTSNFLVTDVFTVDVKSRTSVPLFYKHVLSLDNVPRTSSTDLTLTSGVTLLSISILDNNFQNVTIFDSVMDYEDGIVYLNLKNDFVSSTDYTIYYVKYSVRISDTVFTFTDLLDSEPIFTIADFDDLDAYLNIINDGRKVYLLSADIDEYQIILPSKKTYSYVIEINSRIK